ncbi:MAG: hypothetical protein R2932_19005 [Caldilineaceae bacterium]
MHHLVPFRTFGYVAGLNEHYLEANRLENLVLVCRTCHRRLEAGSAVRSGLDGLAYALTNIAPLHLMCDPQDLGVHVMRVEMGRQEDRMTRGEDDRMTRRQDDEAAVNHSQFAASTRLGTLHNAQLPTIYLYERIAAGLGFSAAV